MKKIIIVRFAPTMQPNPRVTRALQPHMKTSPRPTAFAVPGAIVTLMATDSTLDQVRDSLNGTGVSFILADLENVKVAFPQEIMNSPVVRQFVSSAAPTPATRLWTLDELLDLIAANGIDSLTQEQRTQLDVMS
jgi:hypothetical protein